MKMTRSIWLLARCGGPRTAWQTPLRSSVPLFLRGPNSTQLNSSSMAERIEEGGETAAKRAKLCPTGAGVGEEGEGEDRLSALPDDILLHILNSLGNAEAAARTSVLSRRWRRLWALLPVLHFFFRARHDKVPAALTALDAAHAALDAAHTDGEATPPLRRLGVIVSRSSAESLQAWLPIAARRLAGDLTLIELNNEEEGDEPPCGGGAFELPCFEKATQIWLDLVRGFHSLAMPPSGVFVRLTDFHLDGAQLHGPCALGEAVSSPRCPSLQRLTVSSVGGLGNLAIHSASLLEIELSGSELQQLTVAAPALEKLTVLHCFDGVSEPVADISAPQLASLTWRDAYDPMSVQFGEMSNLQWLGTSFFLVYGHPGFERNRDSARLLRHFEAVHTLSLLLAHMWMSIEDMHDPDYLMEEMTRLPDIRFLTLILLTTGHSFGASSFHVFRMCTGIKKLMLTFKSRKECEVATACASGCICDQPTNWKTED
ncbi:uncharacterized protein LOC100843424 [Brachypodium distachyon]|uniref:F-box domain-containing protein n=1 Tax=Brachypodium distachyon TaxID=15368 RepID=A0A2K2DSB9_BRADI|nr:uncharacterized protein LOC100843424 [Brachypodium distachyon]PNT77178.1 hypothetical protein BRADI_1g58790v3 [Brachypodium distachyon]|eukprot:XP_010228439.2 uncharacterized protein LOC100843424 [Brachypodium distachyon]